MRGPLVLALPLLLAACGGGPARTAPTSQPTRIPEVITADEIAAVSVNTAYEAVQRLRPQFLHVRGRSSIMNRGADRPIVYLDENRLGDVDALRRIPAREVLQIRWLDGRDASTRYGMGHGGGAFVVTTRMGGNGGGP